MAAERENLLQDTSGAVMVEFTAALTVFFLLLFGSVEFANAFYQWNAATKAVQWGARVAAVSDPIYVATPADFTASVSGLNAGDALPSSATAASNAYDITCNGSLNTCVCVGLICPAMGAPKTAAFQRIVYGAAGRTTCVASTSERDIGMCHMFDRITLDKVIVRYQFTGLGYAGRPGGPVPTITVSLGGTTPLQFEFILIGGLMKIGNAAFPDFIDLPSFATTVTGEDLTATGS